LDEAVRRKEVLSNEGEKEEDKKLQR